MSELGPVPSVAVVTVPSCSSHGVQLGRFRTLTRNRMGKALTVCLPTVSASSYNAQAAASFDLEAAKYYTVPIGLLGGQPKL